MKSKKKRDEQAELEKELILNPDKVNQRKKNRKKRILLTVLCELIILAVLAVLGVQIVRSVGKHNLMSQAKAAQPNLVPIVAQTVLTQEEEEEWQEGWIKYQDTVYAYNEDIMTFLFMGIDKNSDVKEVEDGVNGGQADALFLAVINPHDKSIKVIGINRNTMTDVDVYNESGAFVTTMKAQIAVQHGFGNGVEKSCEYQQKAVANLFYDLPIHGYAAINMSAIPTINDAVGGVDVTVLEDLTRMDSTLAEGADVHLMGKSAFWYVKYRDTKEFASSDMRLARQKQYLNAFIGAAKQAAKKDISVAVDLYQAILPQMVTNVTVDEVAYLAPMLVDYRFDENGFYMIDGETVMGEQFEEFYADEQALYELILEVFYEEVKNE